MTTSPTYQPYPYGLRRMDELKVERVAPVTLTPVRRVFEPGFTAAEGDGSCGKDCSRCGYEMQPGHRLAPSGWRHASCR